LSALDDAVRAYVSPDTPHASDGIDAETLTSWGTYIVALDGYASEVNASNTPHSMTPAHVSRQWVQDRRDTVDAAVKALVNEAVAHLLSQVGRLVEQMDTISGNWKTGHYGEAGVSRDTVSDAWSSASSMLDSLRCRLLREAPGGGDV